MASEAIGVAAQPRFPLAPQVGAATRGSFGMPLRPCSHQRDGIDSNICEAWQATASSF